MKAVQGVDVDLGSQLSTGPCLTFWTVRANRDQARDRTGLDEEHPPPPLWVGVLPGRSYTSVLMLQLRVNMSLMVSDRARLGLR